MIYNIIMAIDGCPGSKEITNPFPEPLKCVYCGADNEIWSDEPDMTCSGCGKTINREMRESCISWCPAAKQCLGAEKYERLMKAMKK